MFSCAHMCTMVNMGPPTIDNMETKSGKYDHYGIRYAVVFTILRNETNASLSGF